MVSGWRLAVSGFGFKSSGKPSLSEGFARQDLRCNTSELEFGRERIGRRAQLLLKKKNCKVKNLQLSCSKLKAQNPRPNKKAQFYIFTAIILISLAFGLSIAGVRISKPRPSFEDLKQNFMIESSHAVNSAIYARTNLSQRYQDFVARFLEYSATRDRDFGLLYILVYGNFIELGNKLADKVRVNGIELEPGQKLLLNKTPSLAIVYDNYTYTFGIPDFGICTKALFASMKKEEVWLDVWD